MPDLAGRASRAHDPDGARDGQPEESAVARRRPTAGPYARILALQRSAGNRSVAQAIAIQRNGDPPTIDHSQVPPALGAPPAAAVETEEHALGLVAPVLTRFQQAVDTTDEGLVRAIGTELTSVWERVELARLNRQQAPQGAGSDDAYNEARRSVLRTVPAQRFRGTELVEGPAPPHDGALGDYVREQVGLTAWAVKDAAAAAGLLNAEPPLAENDAWTVVGLLRQHLNPWQFALMLAAIRAAGREDRLARLPPGPAQALQQLRDIQPALRALPGMDPSMPVAKFGLVPDRNAVQLVQPLSPTEIANELYGAGAPWREVLFPLNRTALAGASDNAWLPAGTQLMVQPDALAPAYRMIFAAAATARAAAQHRAAQPVIRAEPDGPIVAGNKIRLAITWPNAAFGDTPLSWSVENDPGAVASGAVPQHVDGPEGQISWGGQNRNVVWEPVARAPGNHVIHCRLRHSDGTTTDATYTVVVMTPEERLGLQQRAEPASDRNPDQMLQDLRRRRDETRDPQQREQLDTRIRQMEESLQGVQAVNLRPLHASYVSSDERAVSVNLKIFADVDRDVPSGDGRVHLKLWDFTLNGPPRTYTASAGNAAAALTQLIQTFGDDAPYPTGRMRVAVPAGALSFPDVPASSVDAETDGGMLIDDLLRALSMVALGVGVVGAAAGQPEIAIPAFVVSGALAGGAAAFDIADRLEHGDFEWDLQTGMDLLDIAAAVLTAGTASAVTTSVRGAGRVTVLGTMNRAVGVTQIAVQAGVHAAAVASAIRSGEQDRIVTALGQALAAGALFLIVHRASANLGASVDDALGAARGTRTATGGVNPEGLARLMNSLPEIPVDEAAMRAFAGESVGIPRDAVRLVPVGGGVGEGVSGSPVWIIRNANDEIVGALKHFRTAEEFARELSALERLRSMQLGEGRAPTPRGVARSGPGGLLVSSAAEGQALNRMMGAAGRSAGPERVAEFARLRDAMAATARALSRLHSAGPRGQVAAAFVDRHVNAALDIMRKLEARAAQLAGVGFDAGSARTRLDEMVGAFREHPGESSVVHGDAHPGNFFYDPATGITMIDTPTLHYSLDANGNPIGTAARDVGNFGQKLAHFGREYGLRPDEIAQLQATFADSYREAGGGPSTPQADAFFRARAALGELVRTAEDARADEGALRSQADLARQALGLPESPRAP